MATRTYLEIGTADFDTLNDKFANREHWRGVSIEAVPEHFERLCKLDKNEYVNAVCLAEGSGVCEFHHVPSEVIARNGLPSWLRGCGSVDKAIQPSLRAYNQHVVTTRYPAVSIREVLNRDIFKDQITGKIRLDLLKIDTEGYDLTLLNAVLDITCPTNIIFETWGISPAEAPALEKRLADLGYSCRGRSGDNVQYSIPSVLLIGEEGWSTGSISKDLIHLSNWHGRLLNWKHYPTDLEISFAEYDAVIIHGLHSPTVWPALAKQGVICNGVCELDPSRPWQQANKNDMGGGCFGSVSRECFRGMSSVTKKEVFYTPASARLSRFTRRPAREVKTLGWCGIPDSAFNFFGKDLKRFSMFKEIADATGLKTHVSGRNYTYGTMQEFYDSIDLLVCTSLTEGGPLPVFEAVACGVPVISTKVGLVKETNIATFSSVPYAVSLVNSIRSCPDQYADTQYKELEAVSMERSIRHWEEFFAGCAKINTTKTFL